MPDIVLLAAIIGAALLYDFYNGLNDCANSIATTVTTRALRPWQAVGLAALFNFVGAFVSTKVAATIGKGVVDPEQITLLVVLCGVLGGALWTAICSHYGIPISVTHALVGGLIGAGTTALGVDSINAKVIGKVLLAMVISPVAGFIGGLILLVAILWIFRRLSPFQANRMFRSGQIVSASFMALSHGMNDAQNAMGVITMALLSYGVMSEFRVPLWVVAICAGAMALGTSIGGWKVIRTMGQKVTTLKPTQGFAAETSAATVITIMSQMGMPISTTHVIASAIMGTGVVQRLSDVRWLVVVRIVITWVVTIPGAALLGALLYLVLSTISG